METFCKQRCAKGPKVLRGEPETGAIIAAWHHSRAHLAAMGSRVMDDVPGDVVALARRR